MIEFLFFNVFSSGTREGFFSRRAINVSPPRLRIQVSAGAILFRFTIRRWGFWPADLFRDTGCMRRWLDDLL